jgi:hypothetical protein
MMLDPLFIPGQWVTVDPRHDDELPLAAIVVMPKVLALRLQGVTPGYTVKLRGEEKETWVAETRLRPRREAL